MFVATLHARTEWGSVSRSPKNRRRSGNEAACGLSGVPSAKSPPRPASPKPRRTPTSPKSSSRSPILLWINGPFGGGKTQTAYELHRRLQGSLVCDPEHVGYGLHRMLPPTLRGDFQDLHSRLHGDDLRLMWSSQPAPGQELEQVLELLAAAQ